MGNTQPRTVYGDEGLGSVSGVVTSFPVGYTLGEERTQDGVKYRLFYNGGADAGIGKGFCFVSSLTVGNTPFSVTVSTITETVLRVEGAVVNTTVPTGGYFWGAVSGGPVALRMSNISVATNALIMVTLDGMHTLTATTTAGVGRNGPSTAACDAVGGAFYVYYEHTSKGR